MMGSGSPSHRGNNGMARLSGSMKGLFWLALLAVTGCGVCRPHVRPHAACTDCQGVVYAVDGAGDFQATSSALREAVAEAGLPLCVETVEWSHGFGRVFADHLDYEYAVAQ